MHEAMNCRDALGHCRQVFRVSELAIAVQTSSWANTVNSIQVIKQEIDTDCMALWHGI